MNDERMLTRFEFSLSKPSGGRRMSEKNMKLIDEYINTVIAEYKNNKDVMEQAAMECAVKVSNANSKSRELAGQSTIKNIFRTITGKNRKMRAEITSDMAQSQYAAQRMLVKMQEQNALTMDVIVTMRQETNMLFLEVDERIIKTNQNISGLYDRLKELSDDYYYEREKDRKVMLIACPNCGNPMNYNGFYCPSCGHINANTNERLSESSRDFLLQKIGGVQNALNIAAEHKPIVLWDKTVSDLANRAIVCRKILETDGVKEMITPQDNSENVKIDPFARIDGFVKRCRDTMFRVVIVGSVKAGKSTLINALLGDKMASTAVTPETSVPAQFCASNDSDYIKISFYTKTEWDALTKSGENKRRFVQELKKHGNAKYNKLYIGKKDMLIKAQNRDELKELIKKWTDSETPEHYYVSRVVIGIKDSIIPEGIMLVDTPGLNDPVKYRSDITKKYIHEANAVMICLNSQNFEENDYRLIFNVQTNLDINKIENVFIIATQVDKFNDPLTEWPEQKKHFIAEIGPLYKGKSGKDKLLSRLFGVSAYLQNYINEYNRTGSVTVDKTLKSILNLYEIDPVVFIERKDDLEKYAGVKTLLDSLQKYLFKNYRSQLVRSIETQYTHLCDDIVSYLNRLKNEQKKIVELSGSDADEIKKRKTEQEQELDLLERDKFVFDKFMTSYQKGYDKIYRELYSKMKGDR